MRLLSWLYRKRHGRHGASCPDCEKLLRLRKEKDVAGLIEFLHNSGPDHRPDAMATLVAVTGKEFGDDPKVWRGWWRKQTENT